MINFATIGRNFVTDWFIEAAKETQKFCLFGVYSRSQNGALEYAKEKGAEKIYTSIDDMCKDEKLDMVYIASPNLFHEEQTVKLLSAGKHVLCEKPAALSYQSFMNMINTAENSGSIFMEGMVPLHMPAFEKLKNLIGKIGKIRQASFVFCQYSSRYDRYKNGEQVNTFDPTLGNGAFMDLGIYCVSVMLALFGYPKSVYGSVNFLPGSIDGCGVAIASYDEMNVELSFSKVNDSLCCSEIRGEDGVILIDKISRPKKLTLILRGKDTKVYDMTPLYHEMYYEAMEFALQIEGKENKYFNEISMLSAKFAEEAREKMGIDFKRNLKNF